MVKISSDDKKVIQMRLESLEGLVKQQIETKLKYDENAAKWIKDWNFWIEMRLEEEKRSFFVKFKDSKVETSLTKFEGKPKIILKGKYSDIVDYCNGELDRLIDVILLRKIKLIKGLRLTPLSILTWKTVDDIILLDRLDKLMSNK